jgi:hypothetical protein
MMRGVWSWFVGSTDEPLSVSQTILWWESRRPAYNAMVAGLASVSLPLFYFSISHSGELRPGDDAVEPLALMAAPFVVNIAYTLGWIVELMNNLVRETPNRRIGPTLMKLGLAFTILVVFAPSVSWSIVALLRL